MRRFVLLILIFIAAILSGCGSSVQISTPSAAPKPTWTMHPHAVLKACIYYEGEVVNIGYLKFFNKQGVIDYLDWVEMKDGCKEVILSPGYYEISASYFQQECADVGSGCKLKENLIIEVFDGEVLEYDFEVYLPE